MTLVNHEPGPSTTTSASRTASAACAQAGETDDFSPEELLRALGEHAERHGGLFVDAIVADSGSVFDHQSLRAYARDIGARLVLSRVAADDSPERHDPARLAGAYQLAVDEAEQ